MTASETEPLLAVEETEEELITDIPQTGTASDGVSLTRNDG